MFRKINIKAEQKFIFSIYTNRFISLISEYGYTILLNILLSKVSLKAIMYFWLVKVLAALFSSKLKNLIANHSPKILLIILEITKAILLISLSLSNNNIIILALVFAIEIMNILFNAQLYSIVPRVVSTNNLIQFNSVYTSIGSISYFVSPLIVGIFINFHPKILFVIYGGLVFLGALSLTLLPPLRSESKYETQTVQNKNSTLLKSDIFKNPIILFMLLITTLLGSVGVVFDTYEVSFITKNLGISDVLYSYSLSFLAIAFLVTSLLFSFIKTISKYAYVYSLSSVIYLGYLLTFAYARDYLGILFSYILLAIGQTISGIVENNYTQTHLNENELKEFYIISQILNIAIPGVLIMFIGFQKNISEKIPMIYREMSIIASFLVIIFIFLLLRKSKSFNYTQKNNLNE
ncbi:MFS transporter [Streptococcus catagoni]|uniref:MFS transporter n=1 Tax=Streptococcus catagoni TaxID=2654874 RepID=UPI00140E5278|nr:MFS transporter [Streptococcus catagoni]